VFKMAALSLVYSSYTQLCAMVHVHAIALVVFPTLPEKND